MRNVVLSSWDLRSPAKVFRSNATYLITGGLGALGLTVAEWMVECGARNVVLMGRRDAPATGAETLTRIRQAGGRATVIPGDIALREDTASVLDTIERSMPPLRGLIHAAGIVDDGTLLRLHRDQLRSVTAPKVTGAWNLHNLTRDAALDFFVLFSSGVSLMGAPGLATYAAANVFLDGLAHHRRAQGLPALSINWSYWAGLGMAERSDVERLFRSRGVGGLTRTRGLAALGFLLSQHRAQVAVMAVDWQRYVFSRPAASRSRPTESLIREHVGCPSHVNVTDHQTSPARDRVMSVPPIERKALVESVLAEHTASALGLSVSRLDRHQLLTRLGLDSLMAMELGNRLESDFGVRIPAVRFLEAVSLEEIAGELMEQLKPPPKRRTCEAAPSYPLSHGQQALWYLNRLAPDSAAYNIVCVVSVHSPLDVPTMRRALLSVTRRHAPLRTIYPTENGRPIQCVQRCGEVSLEVTDCQCWSREKIEQRMLEDADRPFDLERGPLLRVNLFRRSTVEVFLQMTFHHIAVDLWSLELLIQELSAHYRAAREGVPSALAPLESHYGDYVYWQESMLAGSRGERLWTYWKQRLAGELPRLHLPTDHPRPALKTYCGSSHEFRVAGDTYRQLMALAKSEGATLYMVLVAAFQVLLSRYSGQQEIVIGSPTNGRSKPEHGRLVGYFSNPVVLREDLSSNPTFRNFLCQVRATVLGAMEHQDYPFSLLVERLQLTRDSSRSPVFDVAFTWEKTKRPGRRRGGLTTVGSRPITSSNKKANDVELEHLFSQQRGAPFDLTLSMNEEREGLSGTFQYNTDLFKASRIERMATHFGNLLEAVASGPDQPVGSLGLLGENERAQILVEWNQSAADYPLSAILPELFEAQVKRTPNAVAVRQDENRLTYAELNRRANQLAHHLRGLEVWPEVRVGVFMPRSLHTIISILGILKAGGAYVPVDSSWPRDRVAAILADAGISIIVTVTEVADSLPRCATQVIICLDAENGALPQETGENMPARATPGNLAYVIYTSGSTGQPKGVMIPHRGLVNYLWWSAKAYAVDAGQGSPVHTSIGFDLTITGLFSPLLVGKPVTFIAEDHHVEALSQALRGQSDFSFVKLTPAHLELIARRSRGESLDGGTKALVIGGEALSASALSFWRNHAPATRLLNEYGPTEAAVGCCVYEVPVGSPPSGSIPIGHPISNARMYVLDGELEPVPIGVVGELYIAGDGLARGYLNKPGVTADRFIPDPFSDLAGARLYRTGDLGRHLETGDIEFIGRADRQIKIRGFRIEPAEIESLMDEHPLVRESLVLQRADRPWDRRLVAYWVGTEDSNDTTSELRRFLKEKLPHYMVPSDFVRLDQLPLTPNGKIDRLALPAPGHPGPAEAGDLTAPRTPVERKLAEIWARVLGMERVGIHDNFFDLGGTSLSSVEIAIQAEAAGVPLEPELLLKYQTIAELVAAPKRTSDVPARGNTVIESLGVYLPPKTVSIHEVLRGCRRSLTVPLERMTGITSRHVAGEREFSVDLARKAISECLAGSVHRPRDVDLLICCNISRYDGPDFRVTFEPCTSVRLRQEFNFDHAVVLDISNACAGMFTAIYVVDALIKAGAARRAMVVSGEYVSHLTETAQREIEGELDPRLACLTLGDAGAALILEGSPSHTAGFHEINLYTLGRYSSYCIAKANHSDEGGAIMLTDSMRSTALAVKQAVKHAARVLGRRGWLPEDVQHVVMHQTSRASLRGAVQEIDRVFGRRVFHDGKVIDNLAERGNTATTTQIVATRDAILGDRVRSGDRVVFGISGSGQTIGTALYTFDDLPGRIRQGRAVPPRPLKQRHRCQRPWRAMSVHPPTVRVESVGTIPTGAAVQHDAIGMATVAAEDCFSKSSYRPSDIDVLIYAGVYRDEFMCEPAIAAILAGELRMNDDIEATDNGRKTFAFDVFNGAVGFLKACYLANHLIDAERASTVMIVASEIENNRDVRPEMLLGIEETGSAMILDRAVDRKSGFGTFLFKYATRFIDTFTSYTGQRGGRTYLCIEADPERETHFLHSIPDAIEQLLELEKVRLSEIQAVLPPQISSHFARRLARAIGVEEDRVVDVAGTGNAYVSSSLPYGWLCARRQRVVRSGDLWLLISVGSGIEIGCVLYRV